MLLLITFLDNTEISTFTILIKFFFMLCFLRMLYAPGLWTKCTLIVHKYRLSTLLLYYIYIAFWSLVLTGVLYVVALYFVFCTRSNTENCGHMY